MKIFKELKKLGYIHYSATTIEELDDSPLNSAERVSEQALVLRWFREKYKIECYIKSLYEQRENKGYYFGLDDYTNRDFYSKPYCSYEEAELECLKKLIEITQNTNK